VTGFDWFWRVLKLSLVAQRDHKRFRTNNLVSFSIPGGIPTSVQNRSKTQSGAVFKICAIDEFTGSRPPKIPARLTAGELMAFAILQTGVRICVRLGEPKYFHTNADCLLVNAFRLP
jgi:hypothetical protein